MRKNTVISFIGLLFCLCIQAQGTSTSVNSTVNDVDWARAEKFSSDALEQYIKGKRPYPNWIEGSSYFYYNVKEDNGVSYYLVNAHRNTDTDKGRKQKEGTSCSQTIVP